MERRRGGGWGGGGVPLVGVGLREMLQVPTLQGGPVADSVLDQQGGFRALCAVLGMLLQHAADLIPFQRIPPVQGLHRASHPVQTGAERQKFCNLLGVRGRSVFLLCITCSVRKWECWQGEHTIDPVLI